MDQNHSNGNSDSEVGSETLLPRNLFGVGREGEKFPEQRGEGGGGRKHIKPANLLSYLFS